MKVICAWCSVVIRNPLDSGPVSHGMCGACSVEQLARLDAQHFRGVPTRSLGRVARALSPLSPHVLTASPTLEPVASSAHGSAVRTSLCS